MAAISTEFDEHIDLTFLQKMSLKSRPKPKSGCPILTQCAHFAKKQKRLSSPRGRASVSILLSSLIRLAGAHGKAHPSDFGEALIQSGIPVSRKGGGPSGGLDNRPADEITPLTCPSLERGHAEANRLRAAVSYSKRGIDQFRF